MSLSKLGGLSLINPKPLELSRPAGLWLMSDLHVGARNTDHKRIERDIKAAVQRKDRILINGDLVDGIVVGDPRFQLTTLHKRCLSRKQDYPLDAAVDWLAELIEPAAAAGLLDYVGRGNHEDTIEKKAGISILEMLRLRLGVWGDNFPEPAGYCGFCTYKTQVNGKKLGRYVLFIHHGAKSGRGRTQLAKLARIADCDLVWIGHFHNKDSTGSFTVGPTLNGRKIVARERRQAMTGGYTFAYGANKPGDTSANYASVSALEPGLLGGARVSLSYDRGVGLQVGVSN